MPMTEQRIGINMNTSTEIKELAMALAKAQGEFPVIPKTKHVDFQPVGKARVKYDYADLADVLKAVHPILSRFGLAIIQPISSNPDNLFIETMLMHESGQYISSIYPIPFMERAQEQGAQITYARRYALCALLGIQSDADTDGESEDPSTKQKDSINPPNYKSHHPLAVVGISPDTTKGFLKEHTADDHNAMAALIKPRETANNAPVTIPSGTMLTNAKINPRQADIANAAKRGGWTNAQVKEYLEFKFNVKAAVELSEVQTQDLINNLTVFSYEELMDSPLKQD